MAISTNQKPTIYRNLYENTALEGYISELDSLIKGTMFAAKKCDLEVVVLILVRINTNIALPIIIIR